MKYCLFESGDVVGPFLVEELLAKKGFDAHSLVCPEEHSEEETFWKEAHLYDDFKLQTPEPVAAESPVEEEAFPSEMRHSVEQWNSVEDTAKTNGFLGYEVPAFEEEGLSTAGVRKKGNSVFNDTFSISCLEKLEKSSIAIQNIAQVKYKSVISRNRSMH